MLVVLLRHLLAHAADVTGGAVVAVAITKSEFHVLEELLYLFVLVVFYLLFYRSEVHRTSDYFRIVLKPKGNWVDGGSE